MDSRCKSLSIMSLPGSFSPASPLAPLSSSSTRSSLVFATKSSSVIFFLEAALGAFLLPLLFPFCCGFLLALLSSIDFNGVVVGGGSSLAGWTVALEAACAAGTSDEDETALPFFFFFLLFCDAEASLDVLVEDDEDFDHSATERTNTRPMRPCVRRLSIAEVRREGRDRQRARFTSTSSLKPTLNLYNHHHSIDQRYQQYTCKDI
jgi:hypothetical protein